jgi:MATE family, multidrug efflux pump
MNKEILRLAIPNIISNISVPLLSTVDTALMGRMSALHLGAVGLGAMIFNFVYWNFGFLRMGTTGITAQAFGKGSNSEMAQTLGRALLVALILGVLVLLLQIPLARGSYYLMNISDQQLGLVSQYFDIRIWAAPATLGLYATMGWFFGMQNAIIPLVLTVFINVVNIVCSIFFIKVWGMEVDGVAYGTLIAQYAGIILAAILWYLKYGYLAKEITLKAIKQIDKLKRFLTINRDIFIRTFCLTFAFGFFYSQSSAAGATMLAINVILLQFLNWMSYGVDGFAFASESLVGKYAGAKDKINLKKSINYSFFWGMSMAVLISLVYWIFGGELIGIFTDKPELIGQTTPFLFWMIIFPIISTPSYIWDGIFIGLTASVAMRNTMILALIIYLLSHYFLYSQFGNNGLWLALLIFMAARGLLQWIYYRVRLAM